MSQSVPDRVTQWRQADIVIQTAIIERAVDMPYGTTDEFIVRLGRVISSTEFALQYQRHKAIRVPYELVSCLEEPVVVICTRPFMHALVKLETRPGPSDEVFDYMLRYPDL